MCEDVVALQTREVLPGLAHGDRTGHDDGHYAAPGGQDDEAGRTLYGGGGTEAQSVFQGLPDGIAGLALGEGDATRAIVSHTHSLAATRLNGNNVNVDFELLASSENVLRQKLVVQAINNKYQLLRTAIGSAQ